MVLSPQPDFTGVRIKVERAKHHFRDLEARIERFNQTEPYRTPIYCELDTGDVVSRFEVTEQPPHLWGAIAGDCVHNLRSSLDLLVCEMLRAGGTEVERHHKFPVFKSETSYTNAFKPGPPGEIKGIPKCAVNLIKDAKPHEGPDNPFGMLHKLDIADKHHLLVPVVVAHEGTTSSYTMADVLGAYLGATDSGVTTINLFEIPSAQSMGFIVPRDALPLEDGAVIYRIPAHLRDTPLAQMNMNPELDFKVAFDEVEVVKGEPIIPTLRQLVQFVERFVALFPPLFRQESS